MGFFSSKKREEPEVKQPATEAKPEPVVPKSYEFVKVPTNNVSVIKNGFKIEASIEGNGSLIVGGILNGNIKIDDTLYIEKGARISGEVYAKRVKISGDFEGIINTTDIEITKSGRLNGIIKSNKAVLGGFVNGAISSIDSVEITSTGIIDTKECKSKQIKVVGKVEGKVVASELLEVTSGGSIKGDIITKGIRTEQGGSIIGNIQTYDESLHGEDKNFDLDSILNEDEQEAALDIDPDVAKLINIDPKDMQKYAKKGDEKSIKRIPADKKEEI